MSATIIKETPDDIKDCVRRNIIRQIASLTWMPDDEKVELSNAMQDILPLWHAWLHQQRLKAWTQENEKSEKTRARGVMVLSNMLSALARNTTTELRGEVREDVIWQVTKKLSKLIRNNLDPSVRS